MWSALFLEIRLNKALRRRRLSVFVLVDSSHVRAFFSQSEHVKSIPKGDMRFYVLFIR
jgi:hypothetical protein